MLLQQYPTSFPMCDQPCSAKKRILHHQIVIRRWLGDSMISERFCRMSEKRCSQCGLSPMAVSFWSRDGRMWLEKRRVYDRSEAIARSHCCTRISTENIVRATLTLLDGNCPSRYILGFLDTRAKVWKQVWINIASDLLFRKWKVRILIMYTATRWLSSYKTRKEEIGERRRTKEKKPSTERSNNVWSLGQKAL